jgi:nucleotide-binding universal stress UspA family protein
MTITPGEPILAAVDGSAEARDAVEVAAQLARSWSAELHLVHVWSGHASNLTAVIAASAARRLLADEANYATSRGVNVSQQHFRVGPAATGIAEEAEELGAVLCVLGQHRRSRVGRLVFGSVNAELVRAARCPLLFVTSIVDWPPRRVLVGDDGSPAALAAALMGAEIASLYHADVQLMRADGATLGLEHASAGAAEVVKAALTADAHRLEDVTGATVSVSVVQASPDAALQGGSEQRRTLVAVGTRQHGGLVHWMEGSVSRELVDSVGTLLVVPPATAQ